MKFSKQARLYTLLAALLCAMLADSVTAAEHVIYEKGDIVISLLPAPEEIWSSGRHGYGSGSSMGYKPYRFIIRNHSAKKDHIVRIALSSNMMMGGELREMAKTVRVSPNSVIQVPIYQPALQIYYFEMLLSIDGKNEKPIHISNDIDHSSSGPSEPTILFSKASKRKLTNPISSIIAMGSELDVSQWGKSWLDYSRYNAIVIESSEIDRLPAGVRLALEQYVMAGGSLFFLNAEKIPDAFTANGQNPGKKSFGFGSYQTLSSDLSTRRISTLLRAPKNPKYLHLNINTAAKRFPIVENFGVPVGLFVVLIILFAILIGPVLLIWLSKIKKRIYLLWIVPIVSAVLCIIILTIAILAEGFSPNVRTKSITYLDQESGMSSTIGWLGIYSAILPGELNFSMQTVVEPQVRGLECSRVIDFTGGEQHLQGWAVARMPMYLFVRKCETTKKRLVIAKEGQSLTATNGLGSDIESLLYVDKQGKWYLAYNIQAGKKATLTSTNAHHSYLSMRELYIGFGIDKQDTLYSSALKPGQYLAKLNSPAFMPDGLGDRSADRRNESVVIGQISRGGAK